MARTQLPVTQATHTGVLFAFTTSDQVNGNQFVNDGRTVLIVQNTENTPVNLMIRTNRVEDSDLKVPDRVVSIPNGITGVMLGTFPQDIYTQADGTVWLDCAAALNLMLLSIT
jgi:hypothetical protein